LAGIGLVALIAVVATAYVLLPLAAWAGVRALTLIIRTVTNAAAGALTTPLASAGIAALVVLGALALFGLQRLLGSEEDSSR
jgi:hypothetical protein